MLEDEDDEDARRRTDSNASRDTTSEGCFCGIGAGSDELKKFFIGLEPVLDFLPERFTPVLSNSSSIIFLV